MLLDLKPELWTSDLRGFFNCIGRDGQIYDELKYVWLQGRQVGLILCSEDSTSHRCSRLISALQVWMYCRLYGTTERFHRPHILEAAKAGALFMESAVKKWGLLAFTAHSSLDWLS